MVLPEGFIPERVQIAAVETAPIEKNLNQDFSSAIADCRYRAPLTPRLAQPRFFYLTYIILF